MRGVEDASVVEKKLCCPKCETKVGHFNWSGSRCSCGAWVTPSFYVQSGKVDVMPYAT
jgi:dual specificity phosphatase 12